MDGLISRQAAIQAVYDGAYLSLEKRHALVDMIDRIPTAISRTGKWTKEQYSANGYTHVDGYRCSKCTFMYPWPTNFCPNCGAKMKEINDGLV